MLVFFGPATELSLGGFVRNQAGAVQIEVFSVATGCTVR
jgi:hypothetical protein